MATNTYTALVSTTVSGSSTSSVTLSLSGITGYTDLIIVATPKHATQLADFTCRFNSDTTGNSKYSSTMLKGDGSSATSYQNSNQAQATLGEADTNNFNPFIIQINNYANTTTYKTIISRSSTPAYYTAAWSSLWRDTSAITSITLAPLYGGAFGGQNLVAGTTFTVYGIAAAGQGAKATGGTLYADDTYYYHVFGASGTFTPTQSLSADVLVVAGGGGTTGGMGGGGGAGGLLVYTSQSLTATGYTCTVGGGGTAQTSNTNRGGNGSNSQFGALTASVGGGGGTGQSASGGGLSGGSGGGGAYNNTTGGAGTSGQGYAGGAGTGSTPSVGGGGGGGAGAVGADATSSVAGAGGAGFTSSFINAIGAAVGVGQLISGNYYIAGGGGGGARLVTPGGLGGYGGGGTGGNYYNSIVTNGTSGLANTGSGGGGGTDVQGGGGAGGSGVVIVRYAKA